MITPIKLKKCTKFDITISNDKLICQFYKSDNDSTLIKRNGCWNCVYYR